MVITVKGAYVTISASEGCWVTCWTESSDITLFSAVKSVRTTKQRKSAWYEITDEKYQELEARKAVAIASQNETEGSNEQPMP